MNVREEDRVQLQIIERYRGADTVLELIGELDVATGIHVVDATRQALRHGPSRLVVDLRDIAFLDLTGARALIRCRRLAAAKDSAFVLTEPSAAVRRMFEVSGLHAVFDVQASAYPALEEPRCS